MERTCFLASSHYLLEPQHLMLHRGCCVGHLLLLALHLQVHSRSLLSIGKFACLLMKRRAHATEHLLDYSRRRSHCRSRSCRCVSPCRSAPVAARQTNKVSGAEGLMPALGNKGFHTLLELGQAGNYLRKRELEWSPRWSTDKYAADSRSDHRAWVN